MFNLLNLVPPIRRHRLHRIRILLDPVYEAKSKELDAFRGSLFRWSVNSIFSKGTIFLWSFCVLQLVFVWKIHVLFSLIVPLIFTLSSILVSVPMYLSFRKELNLDD